MPTTLSGAATRLLAGLREAEEKISKDREESAERIHVSNITRGLGFLYERVRNVLDYKEESLWAKNAILRILQRREIQILAGESIGLFLIQELIRGRYLENDSVPETKAAEVDAVLAKYRGVWLTAFPEGLVQNKRAKERFNWLFGIAASEIEEVLRRNWRDFLYFQFLYESLSGRVEFPADIDKETAKLQLYLSCFRSFFQADTDMESWMLWRIAFPSWKGSSKDRVLLPPQESASPAPEQARYGASPEELVKIGRDLASTHSRFQAILSWPFRQKLDLLVKRRSVLITFLNDILRERFDEAQTILQDAEMLEANLSRAYEKRYQENRSRLRRTAIRAVFFILITKMLVAFAIEVPYARWVLGEIDWNALIINLILPPAILMIVSFSIRMPGEESNFSKLLIEFNRLLSDSAEPLGVLKVRKPREFAAQVSIAVLYAVNFAITFGILFWIVNALHFNPVSAATFILFLSIVLFFAIRLRHTANELVAVEDSEHWLRQVFDFLTFPIVEVGRMLSLGFRSFNVAVLLFDYFIEAPFHSFVGMMEEWFSFLRERKESL